MITNRRKFLVSSAGLSVSLAQPPPAGQSFTAGLVPGGRPPGGAGSAQGFEQNYWAVCDQCSSLGIHSIEMHPEQVLAVFGTRQPEFQEGMSRRNLTMLNFAMYAHWHRRDLLPEMIETHLRTARFLKAAGGKNIVGLIAPGSNLGNGTREEYEAVSAKTVIPIVNEIGKRVKEETGILFGYHPEQGDLRSGLYQQLFDGTDPRYFYLWPDIGHFVAVGLDPFPVYKNYLSRMNGTHLRDVAFSKADDKGPARPRMVAFGTGTINLREMVGHLKKERFSGAVFGEGGGGTVAMHEYMVNTLGLKL